MSCSGCFGNVLDVEDCVLDFDGVFPICLESVSIAEAVPIGSYMDPILSNVLLS